MSSQPDKGKRSPPRKTFGRLGAKVANMAGAVDAAPGMKRSTKVVLVMAGTAALATCMATRQPACQQEDPANPKPCPSSGSRSSSHYWHWGGGSSTSTSTSTRAGSTQGVVSRGGFGATGSAVSGHGGS
jgi:hypothetical protein